MGGLNNNISFCTVVLVVAAATLSLSVNAQLPGIPATETPATQLASVECGSTVGVLVSCTKTSSWVNAETRGDSLPAVFSYQTPNDTTNNTYLYNVRFQDIQFIEPIRNELGSATLEVTIVTSDTVIILFRQYVAPFSPSLVVDLRQPYLVQPNQTLEVTMELFQNLTDEISVIISVKNSCLECVQLQFRTFNTDCSNDACIDQVVNLQTEVLSATTPCGIAEQVQLVCDLYGSCFVPPSFEFVSSSQTGYVEEEVGLLCIASFAKVQPLVEWYTYYDSELVDVVASGPGLAVHSVFIGPNPESFVCVLDGTIRYEEVVTVSYFGNDCNQRYLDLENYLSFGDCIFSTTTRQGFFFDNSFTFFGGQLAYQLLLDLQVVDNSPPAAESQILFSLRVVIRERVVLVQRGRRYIDEATLFRQEYEYVYIPRSGPIIVDLDPPVDISRGVVVNIQSSGSQAFGNAVLHMLDCNSNDPSGTCVDVQESWPNSQQEYINAGCSEDPLNTALYAYQTCLNISSAEPVLLISPISVDVTPTVNLVGDIVKEAFMTCYIENAVEYSWYMVAPFLTRRLVNKGSQLLILEVDFIDQGFYVCTGIGGAPYADAVVESEPALVTISGQSIFKVTTTFLGDFSDNLTNPESGDYTEFENLVLAEVASQVEIYNVRPGSIIADIITYVEQTESDLPDGELAVIIAEAITNGLNSERLVIDPSADVTVSNLASCPAGEVESESGINLTFLKSRIQQTVGSVELCPEFTSIAGTPRAMRECVGDLIQEARWEEPVVANCFEDENVNGALGELANVNVTLENVEDVAKEAVVLTSNYTTINETGLLYTAEILENIVAVGEPTPDVAKYVIKVVNNILQVDDESFENVDDNAPSRIIISLEAYITNLQLSGQPINLTQVESSLGVVALALPTDSLRNGLGFATIPANDDNILQEKEVFVFYEPGNIPIAVVDAAIQLPPAILDFVQPGETVPVSFFIYENSKLFRSPKLRATEMNGEIRRTVGSRIIAATVEGIRIENLPSQSLVESTFAPLNVSNVNEIINGTECVFWDFALNGGFGEWSAEGCQKTFENNTRVVCRCDHLTSFAVLVDIYGNQANVALSIISKIGCAVSIVALVITIGTYLSIKKLRTKRPQQILICFSFALLGLYFIFVIGIEATGSKVGCIIVAVLIHYFTLASIAWMAVEATNMYLLFVRVLNANVSNFFITASLGAWGLPLVVVVIILAVDHMQYVSTDYCFLRPGNGFYFGQILLIGLVLLFNFIIFTLVMRQLTCARKDIRKTSDKDKRQETIRRLQNAVAISVLLGLTWVFGLLSLIETANFFFQVVFCIFNSLQGLMIFVLFCLRQKEVRDAWMNVVRCKKDRGADHSKGTGTRTRDNPDSTGQGTVPLTNRSTSSTATT